MGAWLRNRSLASSIRVLLKAGFQESGTHDVPIQGVLKKHTMFTISLNDRGKQRASNKIMNELT